jgi:hypothetical protein
LALHEISRFEQFDGKLKYLDGVCIVTEAGKPNAAAADHK